MEATASIRHATRRFWRRFVTCSVTTFWTGRDMANSPAGKFVHFPLKPVDLMLRLDPQFALGSLTDMGEKPWVASAMKETASPACSWPIWGPPSAVISISLTPGRSGEEIRTPSRRIQARRRVSAGSFGKLVRKVLTQVPGSSHREPDGSSIRRRGTDRYRKRSLLRAEERSGFPIT
jgi:hypothetical protein